MKQLERAWEQFNAVQDKHNDSGACDTEPDYVFQDIIRKVLEGRDYKVPDTACGWQLYSGMVSSETAALELGAATVKVAEAVRQNIDNRAAVDWILDRLWRVDVDLSRRAG